MLTTTKFELVLSALDLAEEIVELEDNVADFHFGRARGRTSAREMAELRMLEADVEDAHNVKLPNSRMSIIRSWMTQATK